MELIDEPDQAWTQQVFLDQVPFVWRESEVLKHVVVLILWMLLYHDHVLDADSELSILIVAWLIRYTVAFDKLCVASSRDSNGTLMDIEV